MSVSRRVVKEKAFNELVFGFSRRTLTIYTRFFKTRQKYRRRRHGGKGDPRDGECVEVDDDEGGRFDASNARWRVLGDVEQHANARFVHDNKWWPGS